MILIQMADFYPCFRLYYGPEFIPAALAEWAGEHQIEFEFIRPGRPMQNSYVERFNRTYRDEILNMYVFRNPSEVREITENWMCEYNEERPHDSLGDLIPWEYRIRNEQPENSNLRCN